MGLAGAVARVEHADGSLAWTGAYGEAEADTPLFIASTTKLYTTAIVLRLMERGQLRLDDPLIDRVGDGLVAGLHVHRGVDHTSRITIRHLLSQTSGLADYFGGKQKDGRSLERTLRDGHDTAWTFTDALDWSRTMGPVFPPGAKRKARYSDTNYQLLGRVIEEATGQAYADALRTEVLEVLGLHGTWLYADATDQRALPLRDGGRRLDIPLAMTSFGPDGGVVADVADLMTFLRGFFEGQLFDASVLPSLGDWQRIFFPLQYGIGLMRFKLPRILSPLSDPPELVGHSGLSGAFAFFVPRDQLYLAGTVNDIARPDRSFRLMLELVREASRTG